MTYPNNTTKLELDYPIIFGEKEITELNVRRPLVRDHLIAKSSEIKEDADIKLFALLAEIDEEAIQLMDFSDYVRLQELVVSFGMGKSKKG